jgi:hypothetical protein
MKGLKIMLNNIMDKIIIPVKRVKLSKELLKLKDIADEYYRSQT